MNPTKKFVCFVLCIGAADDVAATLRLLARAGEDPEREERLDHLDASIHHQGGAVYSAGAAAVPFLIELAATPGLPMRVAIVELVGRFAALQNEMLEPWRSAEHAVTCRAVLVAGHDTLVALLDDDDHSVRTAVAAMLWEYALWSRARMTPCRHWSAAMRWSRISLCACR
ncbi:hypothetical protein ACWGDT_11065 [Streptomyces avermitilis]